MNLEWFSFDESYLISIDYHQMECKLVVNIDARMSVNHPKVQEVKNFEDYFKKIQLIFNGVQYYKTITSSHVTTDPNEDIGNIEYIKMLSSETDNNNVNVTQNGERLNITLDLMNDEQASIFSRSNSITFCEFISEKVIFQVGFENLTVNPQE
jgi:hypothetical protein